METDEDHAQKRREIANRKKRFLAFQAKWIALYGFATQFSFQKRANMMKNNAFQFRNHLIHVLVVCLMFGLYLLGTGKFCACDDKVLQVTVHLLLVVVTVNLFASIVIVFGLRKRSSVK